MEEEFKDENADLNQVKNRRRERLNPTKNQIPIDMDFEFVPNNPYTLTVDEKGLGQSNVVEGKKYHPGFLETAYEELKEFNVTLTGLSAAKYKIEELSNSKLKYPFSSLPGMSFLSQYDSSPIQDIPPSGWTPKSDSSKLVNIQPQYLQYAMDATGPKDLEYRLERIREEQHHDEVLSNGSFAAKLVGGLSGIITDPMSYIPVAALSKYGKVGSSFLKNTIKSLPSVGAYSVIQSATTQAERINGNLEDFFTNAAINTTFGSILFGTLGAAGVTLEKMNVWNIGRKFAKEYVDGIDFKLKLDEKGKISGIQAVDRSDGNLSAAKLSFAQDLADSSFDKSGVFKIPFLGESLYHLMTMPVLGTPLPKLLNNHYKTVRGIADRLIDHNIVTTGLREGKTAPVKFETLMNQEQSSLRLLHTQVNALRLERNGFNISSRPIQQLADIGLTSKNKTVELLGKDLEKSEYITHEQFYDEIQTVLRTRESSEHSSVNEAASLFRKKIDDTYKSWRKAYNLPENWIPPNVLEDYLMRVYDTPYLNVNEGKWIKVISNFLKESDELISKRMEPIHDIEKQIQIKKQEHEGFIRDTRFLKSDEQLKKFLKELDALKIKRKSLEEALQNELRENPEMFYHVEDWNALSSKEAEEINVLHKNRDSIVKEIEKQKEEISKIKRESQKQKDQSLKAKTNKTAEKQIKRSDTGILLLEKEEEKLKELNNKLYDEELKIQEMIQKGEVNPRLYYKEKDSLIYKFKDTNNRLKFRNVYESHFDREAHAKAYYDTILNQTAEDTINQVMGRINGNTTENHLKSRTLNVPDKILYENNFMTKDLMAKTSNYVTYLSRRTNLKNVFNDVTVDGGFEPLLEQLNLEHLSNRVLLNKEKELLEERLQTTESEKDRKQISKEIKSVEKKLASERKKFDKAKEEVNHLYEKAMGIKRHSRSAQQLRSGIMSLTAIGNLGFVPYSMITDLGANGLQHGIWPFIRDGVYPIVQSLGGILKTKESESIRKTAPSVNLALQDVLMGYADKNWSMNTEPYLNLGKVIGGLENLAHISSNVTMTNYLDNGLQRFAGALSQAEFMRILHAFKAGKMTEKEGLYIRRYGLDPEKWADRMIDAFNQNGGGKNKLGGYQSLFWQWQDLEASNEFSRAVYRAIKTTAIQRGLADSPFWADNIILSLIHGFNGWTYASLNRYVIPSMQKADAETLTGICFMLGMGYFVSPMRRLARGEDAFPENQTDSQRMYETISDSGYFSYFSKILSDANIVSGDTLLGDLKNDKYKDRTRAGLLGPSFGQANRMADVISAAASGEMNKADLKKMARMIPIVNASWTWWMSKKLIEGLEIPETRAQAKAQKNF